MLTWRLPWRWCRQRRRPGTHRSNHGHWDEHCRWGKVGWTQTCNLRWDCNWANLAEESPWYEHKPCQGKTKSNVGAHFSWFWPLDQTSQEPKSTVCHQHHQLKWTDSNWRACRAPANIVADVEEEEAGNWNIELARPQRVGIRGGHNLHREVRIRKYKRWWRTCAETAGKALRVTRKVRRTAMA